MDGGYGIVPVMVLKIVAWLVQLDNSTNIFFI
jgi:hypothetical protein